MKPLHHSRYAVALIFAINGFLYANWVGRLPRLQDAYQLDYSQLSLALLAPSIGSLIAMPLTARWIVRYGSHRITRLMLLLFCLLTPLIPITPYYWSLVGVLFALGMSTGSLDVAMNAQAVIIERGMQKPIMSSFHAIFSLGMLMGAGSSALFNWWETNLGVHLLVVCAVGISAAFLAIPYLIPEQRQSAEETANSGSSNVLLRPELLILGLIAFCCMLGEGAMADWTTNYIEKVSMGGRYWAPFGLVAFSGAMMIGRFLGDAARQRYGDIRLMRYGALLATTGLALATLLPAMVTSITGFFLVGLGLATIVPIAYSTAGNMPDLPPGVGISMVTTIGYAGFLVGPPLIGFVADWQGLRTGMSVVLSLFVLMLILVNFAGRRSNS